MTTATTTVRERPILFSGPMVKAILDGRKTMTRRVRLLPPLFGAKCPYGAPGDMLWVRETFQPLWANYDEPGDWGTGEGYRISYPATDVVETWFDESRDGNETTRCMPSIHMPRWASRITLEIVSVHVERLQEITEADAKAEGAPLRINGVQDTIRGPEPTESYRTGFVYLWESINGKKQPWISNPFCWVIEFKRIKP